MAINDGKFIFAAEYIMQNEGWDKFTFDPEDPGGATKWGITLATLQRYRKDSSLGPEDVMQLDRVAALKIYHDLYWDGKFDQIQNKRVAAKLMDIYFNLPGKAAIRLMQRACNRVDVHKIKVDGIWGPVTKSSINAQNATVYLNQLVYLLEDYYQAVTEARRKSGKFRQPDRFLKGWLNRARRLPNANLFKQSD